MNAPYTAQNDRRVTKSALALVNCESEATLLNSLSEHLQNGQGFTVATLNLDHIVKMRRDADFRAAYGKHSHVVADGNPIVWLSKLAGRKIELVPGSELIAPLTALAAELNVPVGMLGATQETLDAASAQLQKTYPSLQIAAKIAPPYGFDPKSAKAGEYLEQLKQSGAGICFLALGAPKQEQLAVRGADAVPGCGFVSIGAGLDFIAGHQTRAPRWVRKLALEWLWRMVTNPRRLARRYWDCFVILPGLATDAWTSRKADVHNVTDTRHDSR